MVLLGIDIGTSGCKVTAIDERGRILDEGFGEYETAHPHPGWAEQDPGDWCRTVRAILANMRQRGDIDFADIGSIALDGSTHNAVLLDGQMNVVRPTIMWTDQRAVAESAELNAQHGDTIFATAFQMAAPTWTLPQMLWLQLREPEALRRTSHMMFVKDYVRWRLTGEWCTDTIEAQGTLFFDMANKQWSEELCGLADISTDILPPLVSPTDVVGKVTAAAAAEFGLPEGTPVVCGCSDSAVEGYAAGAIEPGSCILKLATAGNVNVMTDRPVPHPRTLTYSHVVPDMWYTVVATNTAARAQRWFRDHFCAEELAESARDGRSVYAIMDDEAAQSPPGADGLFFHPYLQGERAPYWDPQLRASFVGATMRHNRPDFIRALLEGVVFSLRDCFRTIEEMGLPVTEFRLIGGGAKSALWTQIVADVFDRDIIVPQGCDASFGSALLAGVGTGVFDDERAAVRQCLTEREPVSPNPDNQAHYAKLTPLYYRIHDLLADVYHDLGDLRGQGQSPPPNDR
ncbi:MAG: xylulokinase [Lentisphaerae bacterium]|jgi:xylulokinase|nr:xylulokinase [Lentisphaerota bacterium]MBT4815979.1 xylulokinase [Lentisphaerota bacterium]MBT5607324.1 xylulokinase [Lentisphaerota bacterium]MBT7055358.1 xylulokinase [Lentisphaerota bacterium]MBT7844558.1 xylulokinase [Lentisphaerota bacterium]